MGEFCHSSGGPAHCGPTEFYPGGHPREVQRNGSDQVASYITAFEGSIGYDEYSYALLNNIPAVKVLNPGGYYVLPTASNVAIALQKAVIDENPNSVTFLMQNLDHVYTYTDPRSYPLSSYSYLVVPRSGRREAIWRRARRLWGTIPLRPIGRPGSMCR
jgi:ABC-type phosphate transport system substrate-binding protein